MREILFRTYDKGRKEYLSNGNLFIAINKSSRPNKSEIYLDVISNADKYKERFVIEQYTGLTDKNGTKIFEGDILKRVIKEDNMEKHILYTVVFSQGCFIVKPIDSKHLVGVSLSYYITLSSGNCVEVIGNIYDNPELLKGGVE